MCAGMVIFDHTSTNGHTHLMSDPGAPLLDGGPFGPTQVNAGTAITLMLHGSLANDHVHTLELTAANLMSLRSGQTVVKTSGPGGGGPHTHTYTIRCGT